MVGVLDLVPLERREPLQEALSLKHLFHQQEMIPDGDELP
jgi:hypothetical protein